MAVAIPFILAAVAVAGAAAQYQQQQKQIKQAKQADEYNRLVNKQRADAVMAETSQREEQHRRTVGIFLGKQRAAISESGTGQGGSNFDLENQSEVMAELDSLNIRYNGSVEAQGLLANADLSAYKRDMAGDRLSTARTNAIFGAASSAFSGYGSYLKSGTGVTNYTGSSSSPTVT